MTNEGSMPVGCYTFINKNHRTFLRLHLTNPDKWFKIVTKIEYKGGNIEFRQDPLIPENYTEDPGLEKKVLDNYKELFDEHINPQWLIGVSDDMHN